MTARRINTSEVAARYAEVRCVRQPNQLSAARNAGPPSECRRILVFLDADDCLFARSLETGAESLRALPECGFVYGFCTLTDYKARLADAAPDRNRTESYRTLLEGNFIWTPGAAMSCAYSFAVAGSIHCSSMVCEDWDIYLRLRNLTRFIVMAK